ncbi:MAG TPA: biotin/lipoyl-containing protein [Thermoanaerobaculia bacterium]|nr:biotin/lipoyl-containing protein [Thermoanaerobaculia bacterium]
MKRIFRLVRPDGADAAVTVDATGDVSAVDVEGARFRLELLPRADGTFVAIFEDGRVIRARVAPGRKETRLRSRGVEMALHLFDPRDASTGAAEAEGAAEVVAAMPGRVLEVRVAEGDRVAKGDLLLILEAMKMQNEIRADADQVVAEVCCAAGQAVEAGALLVRFASDRI